MIETEGKSMINIFLRRTALVRVQGMGGIVNLAPVAALARDREVRRSYPDGIVPYQLQVAKAECVFRDFCARAFKRALILPYHLGLTLNQLIKGAIL